VAELTCALGDCHNTPMLWHVTDGAAATAVTSSSHVTTHEPSPLFYTRASRSVLF